MDRRVVGFAALVVFAAVTGVGGKAVGMPPNVELLMPFVLAAGLVGGPAYGFATGFAIRGAYDVYLGWAGPWTIMTIIAYGLTGAMAGLAGSWWGMRKRSEIVLLAGIAALFYDVITMFAGELFFPMSIPALIIGQVPFSVNHAASSMLFCFVLVPYISKVVADFNQPVELRVGVPAPVCVEVENEGG